MTLTLEEPLTTKKCSCCNKVKKVEKFYKHGIRYRKQRYRPRCIECHKNNLDRNKKLQNQLKLIKKNLTWQRLFKKLLKKFLIKKQR